MTKEELDAIRERWANLNAVSAQGQMARADVRDLLAEVDRLRPKAEAMERWEVRSVDDQERMREWLKAALAMEAPERHKLLIPPPEYRGIK